ncbi:hypothetical protein E4U27_008312 [Claviceps purpurea]|nr:hypothetical protein E4U27_008312 [Claviceps purpurea]
MQMVQSSVSMHYKDTCCNPEQPLQHWIATLFVTAGGDDRHEQDLARDRYHKALQPMRNPNNWELWLAKYDEAASYAEKLGVVELSSLNAIIKDFVTAVSKVAENWTSNFLDYGRDDPRMTRKEMMRKFRIQMTNRYPNRIQLRSNTKQSASFLTIEDTPLDDEKNANTIVGSKRDASAAPDSAPSVKRSKRTSRAKTNVQIGASYPAGDSSKGSTHKHGSSKPAGNPGKGSNPNAGQKCPACTKFHDLRSCWYVNDEQKPAWWTPTAQVIELLEYRQETDPNFRRLVDEARNDL